MTKYIDGKRIVARAITFIDNKVLLIERYRKDGDKMLHYFTIPGGGVEDNEEYDETAIRETKEETGLDVHSLSCCGEVLFVDENIQMMMYIYEITDFSGELIECDEGDLKWIPIKDIYNYPMWEGDKAFLPKVINHEPYFKMKLTYCKNELICVENY